MKLILVSSLLWMGIASITIDSNVYSYHQDCTYSNGNVIENGVSRPATDEEQQEVEEYKTKMSQWSVDFEDYMKNKFPPGFPFTTEVNPERKAPIVPKFPCFCSPEVCKE